MATKQVNLANVFGSVASTLASNREVLNKADTINHDHGDNMVEVFEVVAQAMKAKKGASSADQLAYAAELLRQKQSGSAKYYAGGLTQAAQKYQGKKITSTNAMDLIQTLLGGGVQSSAGTVHAHLTAGPAEHAPGRAWRHRSGNLLRADRNRHRLPAQRGHVLHERQAARRDRRIGPDGRADGCHLGRQHPVSGAVRRTRRQHADAGAWDPGVQVAREWDRAPG